MELTIPKLTFRVEILVFIAIVFFILWTHTVFSCSTMTMREGMEVAKKVVENITDPTKAKTKKTTTTPKKEGFTGANTNEGQSSPYSLSNYTPVNTSSWFTPNLTYTSGGKIGQGAQDILNRPPQPVPLPEGELLLFAGNKFSPECCPTSYSNSQGCSCMTVKQYDYLHLRGGNNNPYSEY